MELHPDTEPARSMLRRWLAACELPDAPAQLLDELNARIEDSDFKIGPSYLMRRALYSDGSFTGLRRVWRHQILPLLEEHHYGDRIDVNAQYGLDVLSQYLGMDIHEQGAEQAVEQQAEELIDGQGAAG